MDSNKSLLIDVNPDNPIRVLEVGTKVFIADDIPAVISAVLLRGKEHSISYQCVWWDDRTRRAEYVEENEVRLANSSARTKALTFMQR